MWITSIFLTAAAIFYAQPNLDNFPVFHSPCEKQNREKLSTEKLSTFHSPCEIPYRQELMLAVMSRMWFCSSVLPAFSSVSTLRTLYSTVV